MAQAVVAPSLAQARFSRSATTRGAVFLPAPDSPQALHLSVLFHLNLGSKCQGRRPGILFKGTSDRLKASHHPVGFQVRYQPLLCTSFASETLSQPDARKVAQELQKPLTLDEPSSLRGAPAPVDKKSSQPTLLENNLGTLNGSSLDRTATAPRAESEPPQGFKRCIECQKAKLLVDFSHTKTSKDGLNDNCRACLGVFKAKRAGRELGHLGLSIEEAWQRAKTCSKCQVSKEIRDFVAMGDRLQSYCRSCQLAYFKLSPDRPPVDTPLKCDKCEKVRPASEFGLSPKSLKGRKATCKACMSEGEKMLRRVRNSDLHLQTQEKLCTVCGELKERSEYYRKRRARDGLCPVCKKCTIAAEAKRRGAKPRS